jgi:hypothetical protein
LLAISRRSQKAHFQEGNNAEEECSVNRNQKLCAARYAAKRGLKRKIKNRNFKFCMNVQEQIEKYISGQPELKRSDMQALHRIILQVMPACKLWFLDGKNSENKTVSNPNIGYGLQAMKYADGTTREFYQIGLSSNKTGISVYIMGIEDKKYLAQTYGKVLGKASVTGYCIRFKTLKDINIEILEAAIRNRVEAQNEKLIRNN